MWLAEKYGECPWFFETKPYTGYNLPSGFQQERFMKIGYPCVNNSIGCSSGRTFRLRSYSDERFAETVRGNLDCLARMLDFNARHGILFFRICSGLIPFASHPVCRFRWQVFFREKFEAIGGLMRERGMRISMHPDQFILINTPDKRVFLNSLRELEYHAAALDLFGLDESAKVQIHVGGVYGDKAGSMRRFLDRYSDLPNEIKKRLVIENDDRSWTVEDCLCISNESGIPVVFDNLHNKVNPCGLSDREALLLASAAWGGRNGLPIIDYSQGSQTGPRGSHAATMDIRKFKRFLEETRPADFDVMLEIKDKEASALRAIRAASGDDRFMRQ